MLTSTSYQRQGQLNLALIDGYAILIGAPHCVINARWKSAARHGSGTVAGTLQPHTLLWVDGGGTACCWHQLRLLTEQLLVYRLLDS